MNTSRIAPIPIAHLQAEMVAFPLASERALELGLTSLSPGLTDDTGHLWRSAERELVAASPSVCLDELVAMRDYLWFQGHAADESCSLGTYLQTIADRFLTVRGSIAIPGSAETERGQLGECAARNDWRWLTLALPPDLLLGALQREERSPIRVDTISPILARRWMDHGFAEPHVHLNAGFDFGRIWINTVRGLADARIGQETFKSPGATLEEGIGIAPWLLAAAIARYMLAGFLSGASKANTLLQHLELVKRLLVAELEVSGAALLDDLLERLYQGHPPSPRNYAALRYLYQFLIDGPPRLQSGDPDSVWCWDPISQLLSDAPPMGGAPEVRFVSKCLVYMKRQPDDEAFAGLFWQSVRIRCMFYRHLVQRPMTPGLQWFVRFFRRLKPARNGLGRELTAQTAALMCGRGRGLRSLEIRISPDEEYSKVYTEVRDLAGVMDIMALQDSTGASILEAENAFAESDGDYDAAVEILRHDLRLPHTRSGSTVELEVGIIFHLTRDRGGGWFEGKPTARWADSHADPTVSEAPTGNSTGFRYGRFYRDTKKAALSAGRLLCERPGTLNVVRGLDLCTDEAGVPSWVMAPLLRYIREAGDLASVALREGGGGALTPSPLRTTVHAGEDFVHLMTGLRRLDEALEYLGLVEGDRLGHALALGVEPHTWAERAGRVAMCREDRLFDLVWEWSWYSRDGRGVPGGRNVHLQSEIAKQSRYIFGRELSPWDLTSLGRDLHREGVLCDLGFPDSHPLRDTDALEERERTVLQYLTDASVFARCREIDWFDPAVDLEALEYLQACLRKKVGRMGLTVEVNPSSNLLIGRFGELGSHPLWRLAPVSSDDSVSPVLVSIGSDDPLTFATTLPEEYQLLYDTLMQAGYSDATAHGWLEIARHNGMTSRFTLPRSAQTPGGVQIRSLVGSSVRPVLPP